ncbi:MAG: YncE family protein [Actinomycetota bacterium]
MEDGHRVAKVNIRSRKVMVGRAVPGAPHNLTVARRGTVATALWGDGRVALVRSGRVRSVYLGGAPHDVKIAKGRLVVANQGAARLEVLNLKGRVRGRIGLKANPHDLAITPGGDKAWVTLEGSDDMAVVNLKTKRVRRYVSTGRAPHDLLFAPNGRLWVTDWHGAVHVYNRWGKHLKSKPLGVEAHHLAFTPDGSQVWITDHGAHRVFVLSTSSYRILARLRIAGAPHHVAITRDGRKAVVADHDRGVLVVYSVATRKRLARIPVGPGPHGLGAVP